jgi:hypothetical protein
LTGSRIDLNIPCDLDPLTPNKESNHPVVGLKTLGQRVLEIVSGNGFDLYIPYILCDLVL